MEPRFSLSAVIFRALCILAPLTAAGTAHAAATTANAHAVTLKRLSIVKTIDLDYGDLAVGTTAGTATVDPTTGAITATGSVTPMGGTVTAAQFYTYGGPLQSVVVNRGPLPVLTRVGGTETMSVSTLTLNGPTTRFLSAAGLLDLRVGGTLNVNANQAEGNYVGQFTIIVTYF